MKSKTLQRKGHGLALQSSFPRRIDKTFFDSRDFPSQTTNL
jgi:hypothetical protein